MIFISKMIPSSDLGRYIAYGRVFSGTVCSGMKVKIMGSQYKHGSKFELYEKCLQRLTIMVGQQCESICDVPCGNFVTIPGIDMYLVNSGTLSNCPQAFPLRTSKYSSTPVLKMFLSPNNPSDLPDLVEGVKRLARSDPTLIFSNEDTGEISLSSIGERQLWSSLSIL